MSSRLPPLVMLSLLWVAAPAGPFVAHATAVPPDPILEVRDWETLVASQTVRFHLQWQNPNANEWSGPVSGSMSSQEFGVFLPDWGPIGSFDVPPIPPSSFFDVFFDVSLAQLPPSALEQLPGGGQAGALVPVADNPPCPPDDHWDGNVDVVWTGAAGGSEVNAHYGTLRVCPGGGNSYIHLTAECGFSDTSWTMAGFSPGFQGSLVNEDYTPAPAILPPTWTGWICVNAAPTVPIGTTCCFTVSFSCGGTPAEVRLCAQTCQWQAAPNPVPEVLDWVTNAAAQTVRFQVRWHNDDPQLASAPVGGSMSSQEFGVFQPDWGPIGSFNVPPIPPSSFFDVFFDVGLAQLAPSALEHTEGGGQSPCLPDDHWDGNVDVVWSGPSGGGTVNAHYGRLSVCPGGGKSYIHVNDGCAASDTSWTMAGLSPGFQASLVNEDYTPAPSILSAAWTGWICVQAGATVPVDTENCFAVRFSCGGTPAEIRLCAQACDWGLSDVPAAFGAGYALRAAPNPTTGSTTLHYSIPEAAVVRVEIFDAAGRLVRTLLSAPVGAGSGAVTWDARLERGDAVASGLYLARLTAGETVLGQKILIAN